MEGQRDPEWRVLNAMHNLELARNIKTPSELATRDEVTALGTGKGINVPSPLYPARF